MTTTSSVLAAAATLQEFSLFELAAYCEADPAGILKVLSSAHPLVQPRDQPTDERESGPDLLGAQRWHVVDTTGLRDLIATSAPGRTARAAAQPRRKDPLTRIRLLRAEETLISCAAEESADVRRIMAATARNYLRQFVAADSGRSDWWMLGADDEAPGGGPSESWIGPAPRLRVDFALATLTESEAMGREVAGEFLVETATDVCALVSYVEKPTDRGLADWFFNLAHELTRRPDEEVPSSAAPDRLLSALSWRRVRAQVEPNVEKAAQEAVSLLRWLVGDSDDSTPGNGAGGLFRFLGHLPDGRNRIEVYSDLLQIVPSQYEWQPEGEVVPGALTEAVADSPAASHLQQCASALEAGLVQMPFQSESALIGLAAHMFQDFAARGAVFDEGVVPRSNQARLNLLGLADVRVDRAEYGLSTSSQPVAAKWLHGGGV
ncbi:hypothetical protein [Kribbella catacumbae]|uniref:hypothetical protein n=1 Tax=Kribbella catacumbae TaxID=460086 RepID=UPI0003780918|nr:hypothetical protein [Kribbella catacumbae]